MLASAFLAWMHSAPPQERAEAVSVFAETVLDGVIGDERPEAAEAALTLVLDDPDMRVRRALAQALASRPEAPRHLVLSLAADRAEVSALLIARSPLLADADLVDLATSAEPLALVAIALRAEVTAPVAAAIVARGIFEPCLALASNPGADIAEASLLDLVAEFGTRPKLREAISARPDLPPSVRHRLMVGLAGDLGRSAVAGGFLPAMRGERGLDDITITATLAIARGAGRGLAGFVAYLRENAFLTPMLLFRSVLGGDLALLAAALADLTGMDPSRVAGMLRARSEAALGALVTRAGLPAYLVPVLVAAARAAGPANATAPDGLSLPVIRAASAACIGIAGEEGLRLLALLRRYEAEAARLEARRLGESLRAGFARDQAGLLPAEIGPALLALADDGAEEEILNPPAVIADRRILRARGLVLAEPIPDLATVIGEWKREQAAAAGLRFEPRNHNEKPGRSRVA